jgi:hypothetical protein
MITATGSTRRVWYTDANIASARRSRVRLFECWYRAADEDHRRRRRADARRHLRRPHPRRRGRVSRRRLHADRPRDDAHASRHLHRGAMIYDGESPYRHNRFPFTPVWCYRRFRDNMPYGPIRNLRDPQEDTNKRASKILFLLSPTA